MATVNYTGIGLGNGTGYAELGLKVSEQVLPKLFAEVAYLKGYMVDGKYEMDAQNSATIIIPTLRRPSGKFHSIKDNSFNPYAPNHDRANQGHIYLEIDKEYNEPIDIPEDMLLQNVIGDRVVATMSEYVGKSVAENINIITADTMVKASNKYNSGKALAERKIAYIGSTTVVPDAIAELKAKIGNADPSEGDTSFNGTPLSAVISNTMEAKLLQTKNQFILESSYGQELLIEGTFGRITLADNVAYRGRILGTSMFVLPDAFFPNQYSAEGTFDEKPSTGKVLGVMGVAEATYRAFVDRGIKIADANLFRGWILQPLYRVGVTVAKPWGIGLLVSDNYVTDGLKAEEGELTLSAISSGKVTATAFTSTATVSSYKYKVGDAEVAYGATITTGWTDCTLSSTQITVSEGGVVTVVGLDANGKAVAVARAEAHS